MPQLNVDIPYGGITRGMIQTNAGIEASKFVRHQSVDQELFGPAASITALTKLVHIVRGAAGTIRGFEAIISVLASDVSRTVTVDLQKSTGGGAFATVLSSTISFTTSSTVRVPVAAVLSSAGLVDGDVLEVIVTVAGGAGTQATGLLVSLTYEEEFSS